MDVCKYRGCIAIVGEAIDIAATTTLQSPTFLDHRHRDFFPQENPYHITLLSKAELRSLSGVVSVKAIIDQLQSLLANTPQIHFLGLGGITQSGSSVLWVVCIWAKGQEIRRKLGLPPKHFHITLTAHDVHGIDKGVSTLFQDDFLEDASGELLDHLSYTLFMMQDYTLASHYAVQLCNTYEGSEKGFLRLGDIALKTFEYKLAMLSFACAFSRAISGQTKDYCIQKLLACGGETEWAAVFVGGEASQLPNDLYLHLVKPWSTELRTRLSEATFVPSLCRHPRDQIFIPAASRTRNYCKIPRYFSWLIPFRIALMSIPSSAADIAALASPHIGIRHVLTLTEERTLPAEWFPERLGVQNTFLPVPDYHPLTIEQMDLVVQLLRDEENYPMLIHCAGGKGRTGLVAACYLAAFGFAHIPTDHIPEQPAMSAPDAIRLLRTIRPISVETGQQEAFVNKWCSVIWKRQSVFPEPVPEPPPCDLKVEGAIQPGSNFYVFVGLPGSGKSWTAHALLARNPSGWRRVNQDDAGHRSACENEVGRFNGKGALILDRCNTARDDRTAWLALAAHWSISPVCVSFEYDKELCTSRAQTRLGHPTLPPGGRVRNAVEQMHNVYVRPSLSEGFSAVIRIRSFTAAEQFVERVSPTIVLLKFPRTEHLLNLGGATADDLVSNHPSAFVLRPGEHVLITEKVDGANMGFSLSADKTQVLIQNRSHYVNPATHEQFKKLGHWVDTHRADLYKVLDRDPFFAQRYILYGEWMAATHSVAYTGLLDWFMAFDLYDRSTGDFADRATLEGLLVRTEIRLVPVLHRGEVLDEVELREMVQRKSQFCEGPVEGVYVKVENEGKVIRRGKVVRGDFIVGNEHWTRGGIHFNQLRISDPSAVDLN